MDRIKNILVAIDFSLCSSTAFHQAIRIAKWNDATVRAVHVVNAAPTHSSHSAELVKRAWHRWGEFAPACDGKSHVQFDIVVGSPRSEICRCVQEQKADLLIMGTHSTNDRHKGVGTIAAGCTRKAETKVLLVREKQQHPFKSVAACIDFSPISTLVLRQAIHVAAKEDAELHVLHVYDDPWNGMLSDLIETHSPDYHIKTKQAAEKRLREFCGPMSQEMNDLKLRFHCVQSEEESRSYSSIVRLVQEQGIELAVLGKRSWWNARDFLMGSTAERMIRYAKSSTLVITPDP